MNTEPVRAVTALDAGFVKLPIVSLGKQLFHDRRLSGDGSLSCASCHDISRGGDDGLIQSTGIRGQLGNINAPTVLNSSNNFRQFWDGRAKSLEQQALGPVANPIEMGANWPDVLKKLSADENLMDLFEESFGTRTVTPGLVAQAIATFESTLITPSPFDRYLNGDTRAISKSAAQGYVLFKEYGCVACHQGVNVGGNMMQHFGAFHSVDLHASSLHTESSNAPVVPLYKVPSLRNVALTGPYFHTGSVTQLKDAVRVMAVAQLGRTINNGDIDLLVAFLESLSGEVPAHALQLTSAE